jgi:hypothetical protein
MEQSTYQHLPNQQIQGLSTSNSLSFIAATKDTLLLRLQTAQSHLNKDAIRIAYMNLAMYYMEQYQMCSNHNNNYNYMNPMQQQSHDQQQKQQQQQSMSLLSKYTSYYYNEALSMAMRSKEYCSTRYQTTIHTILILMIAL